MKVICLEDEALFYLVDEVLRYVRKGKEEKPKWLTTEPAMKLLGIKSKTTLKSLRDTGKIRFTQPQKKIILYDRESLEDFLENNVKNTF